MLHTIATLLAHQTAAELLAAINTKYIQIMAQLQQLSTKLLDAEMGR